MLKIWLNLGLNLRSPGLLTSRITLQARARLKGAYLGSTIIHVNLHYPKSYQLHSNHLLKNTTSHLCFYSWATGAHMGSLCTEEVTFERRARN